MFRTCFLQATNKTKTFHALENEEAAEGEDAKMRCMHPRGDSKGTGQHLHTNQGLYGVHFLCGLSCQSFRGLEGNVWDVVPNDSNLPSEAS